MAGTIILVGADKGGTGKTMVCRAVLEYLTARNIAARAFDTECPAGDLVRFAKDAKIIDIGDVSGQMAVFDTINDTTLTVVDLRAGTLSPTITALDHAKMLDEVRAGTVKLVLVHVLGPTMASVAEITAAAQQIGGGARHLLVKNHINASQFFDWDNGEAQQVFARMADVTVNVPQLTEMACETIQKSGGSFLGFAQDQTQSRVLRGLTRTWLESVWSEFDRVRLIDVPTLADVAVPG
jgi:hypothetical protein